MLDINSILGGSGGSSTSLFDPAKLIEPLMPFIIALTIVSILITILYVISIIDKWRQGRAIIETRNILREMNERHRQSALITTSSASQLSESWNSVEGLTASTSASTS